MSDDDLKYERDDYSQDHPDDEDDGESDDAPPSRSSNPFSASRPSGPPSGGYGGNRPQTPMTADEMRRTSTNPPVTPPRPGGAVPPPSFGTPRPTLPTSSSGGGDNPPRPSYSGSSSGSGDNPNPPSRPTYQPGSGGGAPADRPTYQPSSPRPGGLGSNNPSTPSSSGGGSSSSGGGSSSGGYTPPRPGTGPLSSPSGGASSSGGGSSSSGGYGAPRPGTGPLSTPAKPDDRKPEPAKSDDRRPEPPKGEAKKPEPPKADAKKPDDKKPEGDSGGGLMGRLGGFASKAQSFIPGRGGDAANDKDKKSDEKKPDSGGGGLFGRVTSGVGGLLKRGGDAESDKKDEKKSDDKKPATPAASSSAPPRPAGSPSTPAGSSGSSSSSSPAGSTPPRPGGFSPSGSGGPSSSSPSSSSASSGAPSSSPPRPGGPTSPSSGSGGLGASSNPSASSAPRPGGAPAPSASGSSTTGAAAPKKPDDKKPAAEEAVAATGFLANIRSKLPFGRKSEDTPASPAGTGAKASAAPATPAKPQPGATSQTKQAAAAKADAAAAEGGGGIWEWMTGRGRAAATQPQSQTRREGANNRLPQADTSGWNLDTKLDLLGIGLIVFALMLTFSAMSAEQGTTFGSINTFIGQLFGWGAMGVPVTMGAVGVFLLVTRFGDTPPEIDMVRLAGVVLGYLALLTLFQYVEVLGDNYQCDIDCFKIVVQHYGVGRGGGVIGMNIHLFLIQNVGEIGGFVFLLGWMLVAGMLITRTTATELMVLGISLYRSFRVSWQHQAQRRAANRQIAAQRRAEAAAKLVVSRPATALEVGRPALASGEARQQSLPIGQEPALRVGGQLVTAAAAGAPDAPAERGNPLKGLFNRIPGRGGKPENETPSTPLTQRPGQPTPAVVGQTVSSTGMSLPVANQPPAAPHMPPPPPPTSQPPMSQPAPVFNAGQQAAAASVETPAAPPRQPSPHGPAVAANTPIEPPKAPPVVHSSVPRRDYQMPDYRQLLNPGSKADYDRKALVERARIIQETLEGFGAPGKVVEINTGPVITQFGVEPGYVMQRDRQNRVKVSAIAQLDKDLQLSLGARSIRIEAPVPGKGYVGIEVPNDTPMTVSLRDVMESNRFQRIKSPLAIALGESVDGTPIAADLTTMPHLLVAGTTGSGKSVCVNAIIASLLLRNSPDQVKFIMVDPKRVELTGYNGIPHLVAPVVVDVERIIGVLKWLTREMDDRYKKFSVAGARNIEDFNRNRSPEADPLPYIVAIIDELADLMMLAPEEAERYITRVAAMARATGIHLVIATQRPSADVVTGLIKANFPARIAFAVAGNVDSRVILDQPGAEKLLGRGDMLYLSADSPSAQRLQGVFVSDSELNSIIRYWKAQAADYPQKPALTFGGEADENKPPVRASQQAPAFARPAFNQPQTQEVLPRGLFDDLDDEDGDDIDDEDGGGADDDLFERAVELVRRQNGASVSLLQRKMRIGYARAARLIDAMEDRGIVGPQKEGSSKQRDVLIPK